MTDVVDSAQRSEIMRRVRSKDTGPEMAVRRLVRQLGFGYRLHDKTLPGKPDLVFRGRKKVIFVHGCFWHGHDCARGARTPKANKAYWQEKIARNAQRDTLNLSAIAAEGWKALVIWECEIKDQESLAHKIKLFLTS